MAVQVKNSVVYIIITVPTLYWKGRKRGNWNTTKTADILQDITPKLYLKRKKNVVETGRETNSWLNTCIS